MEPISSPWTIPLTQLLHLQEGAWHLSPRAVARANPVRDAESSPKQTLLCVLAFIRDTLDSSRYPVPRPADVAAVAGDLAVRPAVFCLLTYEEKSFI